METSSKQTLPIVCDAVSVFLLQRGETSEEARVLLMKRRHPPVDAWCEVAGSIEKGEKAWQAAFREVNEETGLTLSELWLGDRCAQFYDPSRDRIEILPVFVGYVPRETGVVLNSEHSDYAWCALSGACERVAYPAQRSLLHFIWQEFVERNPHPLLQIENG